MKIGFLFAGQGSQYVGMGKDLYEKYPEAKEIYDAIDLDFDVKQMCFEGPAEKLNDTAYAQAAILVTSLAIASILQKKKITAQYVAGLSLGEYSALAYAGAINPLDAAKIVRERGKIMASALPEGTTMMAAVLSTPEELILEVCKEVSDIGVCEIANYNCPSQIVMTGDKKAVEKASELLLENGARKVIPLNVSGAFHSSLLEDASLKLKEVLEKYEINNPEIPVVYNVSGKEEDEDVVSLLTKQIKSSVYFMQSISYMLEKGVDTFIEIGPGSALKSFVRKINPEIPVYSVSNIEDIDKLMEVFK